MAKHFRLLTLGIPAIVVTLGVSLAITQVDLRGQYPQAYEDLSVNLYAPTLQNVPIKQYEEFDVRIDIQNLGYGEATNATATIKFPVGFVVVRPFQYGQGITCTGGAPTLSCRIPRLASARPPVAGLTSVSVSVRGKINSPCGTVLPFEVSVQSSNIYENKNNNVMKKSPVVDCGGGSTTGGTGGSTGGGTGGATGGGTGGATGGGTPPPPTAEKADLQVAALVEKPLYNGGDTARIKLSAYNKGPTNAGKVELVFTLDFLVAGGGVVFGPTLPQGCVSVGEYVTCTFPLAKGKRADRVISLVIPQNASCQSGVKGTLTAQSEKTDPVPANNTKIATIKVACSGEADLSLSVRPEPTSPKKGDLVTFTGLLRNDGPDDAEDVIVNFVIPTGLQIGKLEPECLAGNGKVTCRFDTVGAGDEFEFEIRGNVAEQATCNAFMTVNATIESDAEDEDLTNNTSKSSVRVSCPGVPIPPSNENANLTMTVQMDKQEYEIGDEGILRVSVYNKGPQTATNIPVNVLVDSKSVQRPYPDGCVLESVNGGEQIVCLIDSLAKSKRDTKEFSLLIPETYGCYYNKYVTAAIKFTGNDPVPTDNTKTVKYRIKCVGTADLALTHTADKTIARKGEVINYKIRVFNGGPHNAPNVFLDVRLPQFGKLASIPAGCRETTPNTANLQLICESELLETQDSITYDFPITVLETAPCGSNLQHWVEMTSLAFDPNRKNNNGDIKVKVSCSTPNPDAPLVITQVANVTKVLPGGFIDYTVTLKNNGATELVDIEMLDAFGTPVTDFRDITGNGIRCKMPQSPSTATCNVPKIAPNGSMVLKYRVKIPTGTKCAQNVPHDISASVEGIPIRVTNIAPVAAVQIACGTSNMAVTLSRVQRISNGVWRYRAIVSNSGPDAGQKSQLVIQAERVTLSSVNLSHLCRTSTNPNEALVCDFPSSLVGGIGAVVEFTATAVGLQCSNATPPVLRALLTLDTMFDTNLTNNNATTTIDCSK